MILEARGVSVVIDGRTVVEPTTLELRAGTMTALVGPSGCGKTTLLHVLSLLQRPSQGEVVVDGADTTGWNAGRRRRFWRDRAAFVLQDYGVIEDESVSFNVSLAARLLGKGAGGDGRRVAQALELTGLDGREPEPASHLSGGEKQRLAVARAIYKRADVVFVDEPTASLDEANRQRVIYLFATLARRGCTVVVATHDDLMMEACDARHRLDHADPILPPSGSRAPTTRVTGAGVTTGEPS